MEAYLDNSATTRCSKAAADMVYKLLTEDYGNPSSLHMKGVEAENYINDAKKKIAKTMYPFIHWLFPDIPPRHKANEYIAANMAANILGLGWAATPAGLKAMRELQKLEEGGGRASDMMCAFLVLNISSLQLVPINMIAYRSQYGSVNPAAVVLPAICATMISTIAVIVFIKIMEITRYNGMKYNRKNKKKRRWIQ